MNIIPADELIQWSIFKCKICRNRLQTPIMLMKYGNTCGTCYERSDYTNAIHNIELEKLLSKLHVSCNYKERGCTHDGSYNNTCEHEKRCCFRDRMCSFASMDMCGEKTLTNFYDMAGHISNRHKKNVLTVEKNCSVVIQNPTTTNRDIFYLLSLDKKDLLLRTWMDAKEEYIFYVFYYFKDEDALKNSKFSFNMRCENTMFTVESVTVNIQHESIIRSTYDTENAVKIPLATLKYLNCLESVEVSINIDGDSLKSSTNVEEFKAQSAWISCHKCSRIVDNIYYCQTCKLNSCSNCIGVNYCSLRSGVRCNSVLLNLSGWKLIYEIPCENSGCSEILKGNEYNEHKDLCLFKKLVCPFQKETKCNWQGLLKEIAAHLKSLHADFVNKNVYYSGVPEIFFFLKGDDIFKQEYKLASNGDLSIITTKLTTPVWDGSYRWEFHIKRTDVPMIMIITDVCTEKGCKKIINVENYLENGKLIFYTDIKHVSVGDKSVVETAVSAVSVIQCLPSIRPITNREFQALEKPNGLGLHTRKNFKRYNNLKSFLEASRSAYTTC